MSPGQRAALHRIARLAVKRRDYGALDAFVTAYAERARSSLDQAPALNPDGTIPMGGDARPALPAIEPASFWSRNVALVYAISAALAVCVGLLIAAAP